jgi:hypothetical protein
MLCSTIGYSAPAVASRTAGCSALVATSCTSRCFTPTTQAAQHRSKLEEERVKDVKQEVGKLWEQQGKVQQGRRIWEAYGLLRAPRARPRRPQASLWPSRGEGKHM